MKPPKISELEYGTELIAGLGKSTVIADFDFETYSSAGFELNFETNKLEALRGLKDKGLSAVGACVYSQHPTTEVLSLAYNLKYGEGPKLWRPGEPCPTDLFWYIGMGGLLEAWNVSFEYWIWTNVCVPKYGFAALPVEILRCAAAKARAFGLPGSLEKAGTVLNAQVQKDKDGKRLLTKFSMPRNPTENRIRAHEYVLLMIR